MLINELEMAYDELEKLTRQNDVNGKQIIAILLKICEMENKLINEMFYDQIIINIIDDKVSKLSSEINCEIGYNILIEDIKCNLSVKRNTFNKLKKIKNHLNNNFDRFMLTNKIDLSDLCFLIRKHNESDNILSDYWILKNFLNKKFEILEENNEKINSK